MLVCSRAKFDWKLRTRTLTLGVRTLLMGIVNVTPDSFSDGGQFIDSEGATAHALRLIDEGADIVDIGGESTRPGLHLAVSATEELDRVLPVIQAVRRLRPDAVISIDTYKARTAQAAVEAGADIVNDVSGLTWDNEMAATCAALRCGVAVMHTRGRWEDWKSLPPLSRSEVVPLVRRELRARASAALAAGIDRERIVLDPGVGFGKRLEENYPLLAHLDSFVELGFPLMAGASRKGFLGQSIAARTDGASPAVDRRLYATLAANTAAILGGAHILRVHDVRAALEAAAVADAVREASESD
jgi:dihydropteroate synthase